VSVSLKFDPGNYPFGRAKSVATLGKSANDHLLLDFRQPAESERFYAFEERGIID